MPTPKSSEKDSTTDKVFSKEQMKTLTIPQLIAMSKQGWVSQNPVTDWRADHQKGTDSQGFTYKAPGFDPSKDMISPAQGDTYMAGTVPKLPSVPTPELEALRADPEMQQMASKMGVSVDDLVLMRQMALDKYGQRYNPPPQAPQTDQQ